MKNKIRHIYRDVGICKSWVFAVPYMLERRWIGICQTPFEGGKCHNKVAGIEKITEQLDLQWYLLSLS